MRYASTRKMDISNGEGLGVSLFVQGCHTHCYNCFNQETWDFNGGKEWTEKTQNKFLELVGKPYIQRVSILGGEPLADQNIIDVATLICRIRKMFPSKTIWVYTGYTWEELTYKESPDINKNVVYEIMNNIDVLVDGQFIDELKDISLQWCGSLNQRVIDVQKSLNGGDIYMWK